MNILYMKTKNAKKAIKMIMGAFFFFYSAQGTKLKVSE